jgi:acetyltransferase
MVRFGQLVVEQQWIKEIDINPLFASSEQLIALDARVVLYEPEMTEADLPRLAIRPYPNQYISSFTSHDGNEYTIRPIRPEDEPKMVDFHESLSEESVYLRYFRAFNLSQRVEHERLTRICFIDYDRTMALVVERPHPETGEQEIIAVGRLNKEVGLPEGEFSLLVSDNYQGQGLGTALLTRLLDVGRDEGLATIYAYMLDENMGMRRICKNMGFEFQRDGNLIKAEIQL